jgi:hypothetical protein
MAALRAYQFPPERSKRSKKPWIKWDKSRWLQKESYSCLKITGEYNVRKMMSHFSQLTWLPSELTTFPLRALRHQRSLG